jgi:hypothetical protein
MTTTQDTTTDHISDLDHRSDDLALNYIDAASDVMDNAFDAWLEAEAEEEAYYKAGYLHSEEPTEHDLDTLPYDLPF